ncbi:MAG: tetratricopeptide repeat protein [Patescibacteria group bacterium]|jgi:tetratricopeptide (TPR) repeat protein
MSHKIGVFLLKLSRILWCSAAILVPLVMFPWTTDHFDFNKAFVLVILGTGIAASSFFGMALTKSLRVKMHPVLLLPAIFLLVTALSSVFSLDQATSFIGEGGQEHTSLLMGIFLYILLLLGAIFLEDEGFQKSLSSALLVGSAITGALTLVTFVGISIPPFQNTVGVPTAFAVYMITMTMFGTCVFLTEMGQETKAKSWAMKISFALTALATALTLIAFDSILLWALVIVSTLALFTFVFARPELLQKTAILAVPGLFLSLAIVFIFVQSPLHGKFPLEVSLNQNSSLTVVRLTLAAHPIIGSGPGTFGIDFNRFAPPELNSSLFWDTRFSSGMSEFFTLLATHGVLGFIALLLFPLALGLFAFRTVVSTRTDWHRVLPPLVGGITLLGAFFLFAYTVTTVFILMIFAAWIAAITLPPSRDVSHAHSPRLALVSSFGVLLGSVGILVAVFVSLTRYGAEIAFAKAVARDREGGEAMEIIKLLNTAATLNGRNDGYYRNLSNALLIQTSKVAADTKADPAVIQSYLASSVNAAVMAANIGPNDVANFQMLCTVYREFSSVVKDANNHAISTCEKAVTLAPNNPKYLVDVARTYIVRVDLLNALANGDDKEVAKTAKDAQAEALTKAGDALSKAIELKGDYASARYYSAFVEERKGNLAAAIQSMEVARALNQKDVGVSIQLSLLYLRQGKNDLAEKELLRALDLDPKNDNLKWYLSVAYEAKGEKEKAINLLQDLVKTNPDNETVKTRLEKLQKNEPAPKPVIPEPIEPTLPPAESTAPSAPVTP